MNSTLDSIRTDTKGLLNSILPPGHRWTQDVLEAAARSQDLPDALCIIGVDDVDDLYLAVL